MFPLHGKAHNEDSSLQSIAELTISQLAALHDAKGSGLSPSLLKQTRVTLQRLLVAPKVFQPRDMRDQHWTKELHIAELAKAARESGKLDPIDVFAVAGSLFVVDGHCRLAAYRQAGFDASRKIPVRHVRGTLADALMTCASANTKDKLSFTKADKLEAAWRMVLYEQGRECYSLRALEAATTISKSTIQNMRKVLATELDFESRELSWAEVKRKQRQDVEYDEHWKAKLSHAFAVRLRKHFSDKPNLHPEIWLHALEEAFPRLHSHILEVVARERRDELLDIAEFIAAEEDF